ncbi:mediator of RNA polymerase II transcription subunit 13 [Cucurbita pepo subsp. pepo]|uniref:mediator of RNA polymerase II transcription subunit 13 n=1 Tax=Cucurbita pepo subsp. pepo TaxID=3664 RepID=UPI000C9DA6EF|nr:mediator of RNA polymerase II transcription subunit 13 [Cucurbita pepo subsp. pepo]
MWTNIFKIGGLHQISWFQFLPNESDLISLPDKSAKVEHNDAATFLVLSSHVQLQKEGFLSTWTNSFVGPWDPSQGLHNPDEKIKLWLFLPGRHSSVAETAQAAISKLRVVASGLWTSPGDLEEVAAALSQALRNCIERSLTALSYMRFGDVFTKYQYGQSEELFRRGQPTMEFIFSATEEAIFVHAIISAKHIRALSNAEIERLLKHSANNSCLGLPVIVSPHGIRGRFTGCCASDVVKQICSSSGKSRTSCGFVGLPHHVSQGGCQSKGQNCYVEVTLGCSKSVSERPLQSNSNYIRSVSTSGDLKGLSNNLSFHKKTFIYPSEAVLVLLLQTSFARSSLKRFWLQNWIGPSLPGSSFYMHCGGNVDYMEGLWTETDKIRSQHGYDSSSNSNSSSIGSISSSSSDSDCKTGASELEADADSLSCRQSGLSSNDQSANSGRKLGIKRSRSGMPDSLDQMGTGAQIQDAFKSEFTSTELNNSAITGVSNVLIGSPWDWDDDDRGVDDIEDLLLHFGSFGDFFVNDVLPFGEPPGAAESQSLSFSAPDYADVGSSPGGVMDVSDQMLLPVGFPSFDSFNPAVTKTTDEVLSKDHEVTNNALSSVTANQTPVSSSGEFDQITKYEALMTLAPEYGAVETPTSEFSSSIFRSPYIPKSRELESSNLSTNSYIYGATPPSSPYFDWSDEKSGISSNSKPSNVLSAKNYYTHVDNVKEKHIRKSAACKNSISTSDGLASSLSNHNAVNAVKSAQRKTNEDTVEAADCLFMSQKHVLAMEVECLMFQASMCRVRHTLQSSGSSTVSGTNQLSSDPSTITDYMANEVKKKDTIPMRIAGDVDGGTLDGHHNAPVGVWRSVGVPKVPKPSNSPSMELGSSLPHNSFHEDGVLSYGQRPPLQELLDAMPLLVQQATSFVDLALDADCGDGPYGWLGLQEQWRRGFPCGPSMVHAGCGGTLASCHALDIAGVELVDPLSADVYASSVMSLLQSDMKTALKSAFGTLDGPLSVTDWCKGRGQLGDMGSTGDGLSAESTINESKDSSSTVMLNIGEPISPSHSSASGSSSLKGSSTMDGSKMDETSQRRSNQEISSSGSDQQLLPSRLRPTIIVLPSPAILVGYQDDWLKTSANSLQLWEKAPLEPYAVQKPINYCVICPDIDPLASAAADFFQQLGTVYETCKLGTHTPHNLGNQMDVDSGKLLSSGFVLLDCPQSMKIDSSSASIVGSISDYLLSLSNGWDLTSYLRSLSKALKALKLSPSMSANPKEGSNGSCMVLYVICPFPDPLEVLQTVVESSVAVGSVTLQSDRDRRTILCSQVAKSLSCSAAVDESSTSNVLVLQGFTLPKLVLQIVTVDAIFRVSSPSVNEIVILKETAFTVYNKARRISRGTSTDVVQSSSISSRSHSVLSSMSSSIPGMWKDCVGIRIAGHSLPREGEIDGTLRSGTWDNSWQTRPGSLSNDPNRIGEYYLQDDSCYMFEPLFIMAEPGSLDHGISPINPVTLGAKSSKPLSDDNSGAFLPNVSSAVGMDIGTNSQVDGPEMDGFGGHQKNPSLHCCYGWTEDWRWLVCIWTDSRGELLDSHIFPFGGISSRQDTKGLECIFVQVLQQGCMILQSCSPDTSVSKPRDLVIARIGTFYELEYLEWQKAIYSLWGSEVKKWPLQLRRCMPDGISSSSNGSSLQQQEMSLIHDRNLPSSPNPLYSPHSKSTGFMKASIGQPTIRKQLMGGHAVVDNSRGMIQWVHSISFVAISMEHSLQLLLQADSPSPGGNQGSVQSSSYVEGFTPVKSLGSTSSSYILIPSPSLRFLPSNPLQLPTCLTAESPPLAHLLHSKGSAIPLSTGFAISRAVPSMRKDSRSNMKEEWPSALSVSLIDYYGHNVAQEKNVRGIIKQVGRSSSVESRDFEIETHLILESVIAELHALSWMTVSPAYLDRRTALPFHCDMVLRLRRILHFADTELSRRAEKSKH